MTAEATAADPRLAFIFPDERGPGTTPAPRPASDPGPSIHHNLAGALPLCPRCELRVTWQPARGPDRPARILVRRWQQRFDETWWPDANERGVQVTAKDARAFLAAVQAAVAALEGDEHARGEP